MNAHGLSVLQFPEALDLVAGFASSGMGGDAVRALAPSDARVWVDGELERVEQMMGFLARAEDWSVPVIPDLRQALRRLGTVGAVWDAPTLRDARVLMESGREARATVLPHTETFPAVAAVAGRLPKLDALSDAIGRAVDEDGVLRDRASKELSRLRREIRSVRGQIVEKLERYVASLPEELRVVDASVSLREGRYVVPVRRVGRGQVGGIVHDESASGATLFVEPPVAIDMMNRLRGLEREEAREVQRILAELTDALRPERDALRATLDALVELDALSARARFATKYDGHRPGMLEPDAAEYVVVQGRHPLLAAGGGVVPFDLEMEPGERTLVVSGPNTGGKTVLLKAVGLMSAMAQAGIVPPVGAGTRLPMFADVFADIGDEQSIEASLSTFSAHLRNLREIVEGAGAQSLVLVDEIGSGTDPVEGAALARSILVELNTRGALTVATSHLGQLKLLAGDVPGVVNASLQFDSERLAPTYRLVKGVPGRSYGLAIARRLAFPADILATAESLLPQGERDVSQLLLALEEKERESARALEETEAARREAEAARREVEELRRELETRQEDVRRRESEAERRARQQARDLLLHSRREVEAAIRELREAVAGGAGADALEEEARRARHRVEEAARKQAEKAPAPGAVDAGVPAELAEGAWVRVPATGAKGRVVELRDGRATVETGGLRMDVPAATLEPVDEPAGGSRPTHGGAGAPAGASGGPGWTGPELEASTEVDLRGLRADEVAGRLQPALDAAVRAALPSLRIIHGKGTGALREVVSELLRADRRVRTQRAGGPGEGGSGVTVAELA
ncbi:MAG TPA: endonuclease MutS2 [Longimicrobiales bacterium]|nr:endonuclease MutS2 [Longimicrobiales bacterium]